MTSFFDFKYFFNPSNDFVRARVRRFIKIDDSVLKILFHLSFKWSRSVRYRCIVGTKYVHFVIVFKKKRPFTGIHFSRS